MNLGRGKQIMHEKQKSVIHREIWIDCLKTFSILAVFTDHTNGFLYKNQTIAYMSYFSVSLFVLLGGITSYMSNKRHEELTWLQDIGRKLKGILVPYAIAMAIHLFFQFKVLDLKTYLKVLIEFGGVEFTSPFYFIVFYLQLILVSRCLYRIINWTEGKKWYKIWFIFELVIALLFSAICIQYTYILPVHGGGQYLFGGTYFMIYYLGMIIGRYYQEVKWNQTISLVVCIISAITMSCWVLFISNNRLAIDNKLKYFGGFNPPGISFITYAILVFVFGWSLDNVINLFNLKRIRRIESYISTIGKYSLYIFLFHLLIINNIRNSQIGILIERANIWIIRLVYLVAVIIISIGIGWIIEKCLLKKNVFLLISLVIIICYMSLKIQNLVEAYFSKFLVDVKTVLSINNVDLYDTNREVEVISFPIEIKPNTNYRLKVTFEEIEKIPYLLYFDLYGDNYDFPAQNMDISYLISEETYTIIINSENPPSNVFFRIVYMLDEKYKIDSLTLSETKVKY